MTFKHVFRSGGASLLALALTAALVPSPAAAQERGWGGERGRSEGRNQPQADQPRMARPEFTPPQERREQPRFEQPRFERPQAAPQQVQQRPQYTPPQVQSAPPAAPAYDRGASWRGRDRSAGQGGFQPQPQAQPQTQNTPSWRNGGNGERGGQRGYQPQQAAQPQPAAPQYGQSRQVEVNRERNTTYADPDRNRTYGDRNRSVTPNGYRGDNYRDNRQWDRNDHDRNDRYRDSRRWDHDDRYRNDRYRDNRRWDRDDWRRDNRYNWYSYRNSNRNIYRLGRYYAPYRGYSYSRISIGFYLDSLFFGSRYWINDPWQYRLPAVYGPYRWVRYYDDVLLVDIYSGEVVDVIYDFFW